MVTGNILNGSPSIGGLLIVYSLTDDSNIHYNFAPSISDHDQRRVNSTIEELPNDEYKVSVFVLEENGLPFHRVAASPKFVLININSTLAQFVEGIITAGIEAEKSFIEYDILSISTGICITCTFLDSSTTDCVAVVHQQISQLSSSGLMNIESSHKFTRSGDTAYGCIEGVDLEEYQVGVVRGVNQKFKSMPTDMYSSQFCSLEYS